MLNNIKYYLRLYRLRFLLYVTELDNEMLHNKQYRKFLGGSWYFISEIETGEEYWTSMEPNEHLAFVIEVEHYQR